MSLHAPRQYRVVIRHNVVVEIEAVPVRPAEVKAADDPLMVSSELARRNLKLGCMDGEYLFGDAEAARFFAHLSLDFQKRLLEKSIEALNAAQVGGQGWINPHGVRARREGKTD